MIRFFSLLCPFSHSEGFFRVRDVCVWCTETYIEFILRNFWEQVKKTAICYKDCHASACLNSTSLCKYYERYNWLYHKTNRLVLKAHWCEHGGQTGGGEGGSVCLLSCLVASAGSGRTTDTTHIHSFTYWRNDVCTPTVMHATTCIQRCFM